MLCLKVILGVVVVPFLQGLGTCLDDYVPKEGNQGYCVNVNKPLVWIIDSIRQKTRFECDGLGLEALTSFVLRRFPPLIRDS